MIAFALLSLALALLICLTCYGILAFVIGFFEEGTLQSTLATFCGFTLCAVTVLWGIWFIAHRWPTTW
jgi:hypothetical protein